jgi:hypothetical protein
MVNMLKNLIEKVDIMQKQMDSASEEIKILRIKKK